MQEEKDIAELEADSLGLRILLSQETINEIRIKLIEELESKKYTQIYRVLKTNKYHCCAEGILADILIEKFPKTFEWRVIELYGKTAYKLFMKNDFRAYPISAVVLTNADNFIGKIPLLEKYNTILVKKYVELWELNNLFSMSFEEIAKYLREAWNIDK